MCLWGCEWVGCITCKDEFKAGISVIFKTEEEYFLELNIKIHSY